MIHFTRADMWVSPRHVPAYAGWVWAQRQSGNGSSGGVGQYFWKPQITVPGAAVIALLERAQEVGIHPGWCRGRSDGTRVQVFDTGGTRVAQLAVTDQGRRLMRRELWARRRAGDIAPAVVARSADGTGYVESWIRGKKTAASPDVLYRVIGQLKDGFYRTRQIPLARYVRQLARLKGFEERDRRSITAVWPAGELVPVSWVHGDLWSGNILQQSDGRYRLLDWEYTRPCLATADGWYYLYHWLRLENRDPDAFRASFGAMLERVWGMSAQQFARALHLVHLIERRLFLGFLDTAQPHAAVLESDIRGETAAPAALKP